MKQLATLTFTLLCLFVNAQNDRRIIGYESRAIQLAWPYDLYMQNDYDTSLNNSRFLDIKAKFIVVDTLNLIGKPAVYKIRLQGYKKAAVNELNEFKQMLSQFGLDDSKVIEVDQLKTKFNSFVSTNNTALNSKKSILSNLEKEEKDASAKFDQANKTKDEASKKSAQEALAKKRKEVELIQLEIDSLSNLTNIGDFNDFYVENRKWFFDEDMVHGKRVIRLITDYENYATEFFVRQEGFAKNNVPIYALNEFSLGVITIPIKVRFGGDSVNGRLFDFGADASLGLNFGYKLNFSRYVKDAGSFNIMSGISITALQVTPETTKGKITEKTMVAAITIPFGVVFELPKTGNGLQLGIFTGLDFIAGNLYKSWSYSNMPWLSFGLSYNLLDRSSGKQTPDKNKK